MICINPTRSMNKILIRSTVSIAFALAFTASGADAFKPTPYHEGAPAGKLIAHANWASKVMTNTVRDWWVYVPKQYDAKKAANVMVFQDGHDYVNPNGNWRVPVVFDNLIAKGEMPPGLTEDDLRAMELPLPSEVELIEEADGTMVLKRKQPVVVASKATLSPAANAFVCDTPDGE